MSLIESDLFQHSIGRVMEKLAPKLLFDVQWNLYKADASGAWKKCPLYGDVRFIEIPTKTNI